MSSKKGSGIQRFRVQRFGVQGFNGMSNEGILSFKYTKKTERSDSIQLDQLFNPSTQSTISATQSPERRTIEPKVHSTSESTP